MEPLRVAHIIGKMRAGGVEAFIMNYYRHLDRDRVQFDMVIDEDSPNHELVEEIEALGGRVFTVPPYQQLAKYIPALRQLCQQQRWSVVHSHINALSVFPLRAAKQAGVPVRIAHSHTFLAKGEPWRNAAKIILKNFANVYPTTRFACGTDAGAWLYGASRDFEVIPNAIEVERFAFNNEVRTQVRKELGLADDALVVGHIGRFMKQKNHEFLIQIFAEIAKLNDSAVLLLAGSGPLRQAVEDQVSQLGLSDRVKFLGQRTDPERLYQAFDVFVLPSFYEGFPVVAIEAQAAGLPCVMSDAVTHEAGFTDLASFLPLSVGNRAWASKICEVTRTADHEGAAVHARTSGRERYAALVAEKYDINRNAERLCELYLTAVAQA